MIEVRGLTKVFDGFVAVDDVSLAVGTGQVLALLGPNGAGKTTTVRMMTSILAPTRGTATIAGFDVVTQAEQVRAHVGVLTEQHGLYERMKAVEYLRFFGQVYHMDAGLARKRALALMDRFGLSDALDKRLGEYSKGMKQKLALVRALLHDPPVLLLDEPTSAMDPLSAKQVRDAIIDLQRDKRTFLITTHNLTEAQTLADSIAFIRKGKLVANGTFDALRRQFVGEPRMELRVAGHLNGAVEAVRQIVTVRETGEHWMRYTTPDPERDNPNVIRTLTGLGVDVVTLAPVTQTLEDVYLQVVKEDEGTTADAGDVE
ncbi:MAG: ABC transporter ATP-binding protein [Chloroflexi bacterium]|nr:ABC transporter ATP-binding protein [Chloroflexota bacterium]